MGKYEEDAERFIESMLDRYVRIQRKLNALDEGILTEDDPDYESEDDLYEQRDDNYGVTLRRTVEITLAGGGPAAQFEVDIDDDGDATEVRIAYCDWFEKPYKKRIPESHPAWDAAANIARYEVEAYR